MDANKLTPAPWQADSDGREDLHNVRHMVRAVIDAGEVLVVYGQVTKADAEFIALARNAFEVMVRRGWHARKLPDDRGWAVDVARCQHFGDGGRFADPFTALVEADAWYAANVEARPG